ncbi:MULTISPECIES: ABC transporter substrate-binding protein [unclassified Pseudomonas]|uniref:substrate-binding periplasmic protein n=1 Tax=unclassified Pseudomonas TaxID=196821 RepID=UPI002AC99094|nr:MULTISPECIES: ABC transporter substrate-binding protein [unclassified Pseudomonas]MEB0043522.1 ABC transporter substrate-binding protein [Pseudomonas sp. MH10]MEB0076852.1 ABC transporter substrate-binding protein [Pseudomonas sp. MH10out]MEB0103267.1 ABC transporter substrate-binding protein [Pseudomonas sp. CCI3.2]MEB0129709.1 ABC transporter substrate-binding protein [Pseudomonas sp. CCI2.4]MEB0156650.1 ABC transporter substrate-binding protein [Pseudomonas sp. AH2 (2023)]
MFKRVFLAVIGIGFLLAGAAHAADASSETPVVDAASTDAPPAYSVVLLTENFPPYNMAVDGKNFAPDNKIAGISAEILRETFKRAGVGYSMTLRFPWDRIYKLAMKTSGYGVFSTARSPDREKLFKWVGPIGPDDWIMLARADSTIELSSLQQAKKYKIGAYKGDRIADQLASDGLNPVLVLRDQDNARKLAEGQIDLWATGDPSGRYLARQEGVAGLKTVLRFNSDELFLALNKEVPDEIVAKLQKALDEMRAEGKIDEILGRYL